MIQKNNKDDNFQSDLSFEEAMRKIANTSKEDVENAIKEAEKQDQKEKDDNSPEE